MIGVGLLIIGLVCGLLALQYYRRYGAIWQSDEEKNEKVKYSIIEDSQSQNKYGGVIALVIGLIFLVLGTVYLVKTMTGPKDITIEGIGVSLPCTYLDIQAMGFDIEEGQEIVEIKGMPNNYSRYGETYTVVDDSGRRFEIRFENDSNEPMMATSCKIYEMSFEYAPPKNIYEGMSGYGTVYSGWLQYSGVTQEQYDEDMQSYDAYIEEKKEYYENYEILNSPKITLGNDVNSDMTQGQVEGIMGNGTTPTIMVVSAEYHTTREYYMYTGSKRYKVSITYLTKDEIAMLTISY